MIMPLCVADGRALAPAGTELRSDTDSTSGPVKAPDSPARPGDPLPPLVNPSLRIDVAANVVVIEWWHNGEVKNRIPTDRELAAYRDGTLPAGQIQPLPLADDTQPALATASQHNDRSAAEHAGTLDIVA